MQSCHFSHIFANAHYICHCHAFNWPEHNQWSIRTYSNYANGRPKLLVWQWPFDEAVRCIRHRPIRVKNYCHVPILYRRHKLVKYDSRDGCSIYTEDFKLHYGSWLHEGCGADMQCVEGLDRSDQPGFVCRGDGPFLMKTKLIPADGIDIISKIVSRLYDCYTTKYALYFAFDSHTNLCLAFKKTKAIITNMKFSYGKTGTFWSVVLSGMKKLFQKYHVYVSLFRISNRMHPIIVHSLRSSRLDDLVWTDIVNTFVTFWMLHSTSQSWLLYQYET